MKIIGVYFVNSVVDSNWEKLLLKINKKNHVWDIFGTKCNSYSEEKSKSFKVNQILPQKLWYIGQIYTTP